MHQIIPCIDATEQSGIKAVLDEVTSYWYKLQLPEPLIVMTELMVKAVTDKAQIHRLMRGHSQCRVCMLAKAVLFALSESTARCAILLSS